MVARPVGLEVSLVAIAKGRPRKPNAVLRYTDGKQQVKYLWVMEVEQEIGMEGLSYQSRWTKRFYPRSFKQGPLVIKGRCASMADQTRLAFYIRKHQLALVKHAGERFFSDSPFLMKFSLPSEDIFVLGFVPTFEIHKQGHFAPAPEYEIRFEVLFDRRHSNKDPMYSFAITDLAEAIQRGLTPEFEEQPDSVEPDFLPGSFDAP